MPELIILRGNSGSGKTSVAKTVQQCLGPNTMLLSHDMIRMQMLHVWGKEGIEKSLPLMQELIQYGAAHSQFTILEGILDSREYAALFETCREAFDGHIHAYYYDLSFEETLRRHRTKPNCNEFGEEEMKRWWRGRDLLLTIDEIVLTENAGFDETVERIIDDVRS